MASNIEKVDDILASIPDSLWDKAVQDLESNRGVATVDLSQCADLEALHAQSFRTASDALDTIAAAQTESSAATVPIIAPDADSGHVTGYHGAGSENSMSRYNAHREGFVFSDGDMFAMTDSRDDAGDDFKLKMQALSCSLHGIAHHVLLALERRLELPKFWFRDQLGATSDHSQWHVKRYVTADGTQAVFEPNADTDKTAAASASPSPSDCESPAASKDQPTILLPMHTDPSLISVVVHDSIGKCDGGLGLQYQTKDPNAPKEKRWQDLPFHGHAVATVFTGSILSYITGTIWPGAKHRVVQQIPPATHRMAATLFLRPQGTAMLAVPPSPALQSQVKLKKQIDFNTWNARVARNYSKNSGSKKGASSTGANGKATNSAAGNSTSTTEPKYSYDGHYKDGITEMSWHACNPPLHGREKFLGGECAANGKIYAVPGHTPRVLVIDPRSADADTNTTNGGDQSTPQRQRQQQQREGQLSRLRMYHIGPSFPGEFKWLRAVLCPQTKILYAIPCHADSILRIDPSTDTVSTVTWDAEDPLAPPLGMLWKYHGGNISKHDGCLYCIPQRAKHIMKFDPVTEKISFFGGPLEGFNKWYGGLVGPSDGAIYGINQCASGVLRIDPVQQTATVHGDFPEGGYKWHGGVVTGPYIYGIPAHAERALKITPGLEPTVEEIGEPLRTGQHRTDGKYKFLGGAVGLDGCCYFFPSDADFVVQINPATDVVREVGPNLRDLEPIHHNKWQNGFTLSDGCIYAIPLKARGILRIRTFVDGSEPIISVIGGPYEGLNKWEGGVLSQDGRMFCMPLNCAKVLQIRSVQGHP